jgi:hypothetical protein
VKQTVQLRSHKEIHICFECLDWLDATRDRKLKAHGGGWRVVGSQPIFSVTDIARSMDHYSKLGFEIEVHDETYAFAHRESGLTIHLALSRQGPLAPSALYLLCEDADELADTWRRAGLVVRGPEDFDYGKREGSHNDPDGNLIRFGSPL